jgi:hypothetical protein
VQTIATRFAPTAQSQLPAELLTLAEPPLRVSHTGGSVSLAMAWPPPDAVAAANPPGVVQTASATEPLPDDRASALHLESDSANALAPRAPIAYAEPPPAVHMESTVAPAPDAVAVESHLRSALASASPLPLALELALPLLVTVEIATPPFLATAIAFEVPSDDASQTAVSPVLAMSPDLETHRTPAAASAKTASTATEAIAAHASSLEITLSAPGVIIDSARPDTGALRLNYQPVSIKTTIAETRIAAVLHRRMSTFPQPASSRPYDAPTEIAVRQELGSKVGVGKIYQHYLESRFPSLFHRGNAVGVLRDEDQPFDDSINRIGRDIQAYPHVNALLFENRLEVLVGNRAGDDGRLSWLVSPKLEHTSADREKVLLSQVAQPLVGTVKLMPLS